MIIGRVSSLLLTFNTSSVGIGRGSCMRQLLACMLLLVAQLGWAAETVPLYTYYSDPPFSVSWSASLTRKLADALTAKSEGAYRFKAVQLPRLRLDKMIAADKWPGLVAWANPSWFDDEQKIRFAWSHPFMADADLVLSTKARPVEYEDAGKSLEGLRLGGVMGHRYADVQELIESGKLIRDDADSELQSVLKLKYGRVQVTFVQASSLAYLNQEVPDLDHWLYIAHRPRGTYRRHLFASKSNQALIAFVDAALRQLGSDPFWQSVFSRPLPPVQKQGASRYRVPQLEEGST